MLGDPDYLSGLKRVLRMVLIIVGIVILVAADLLAIVGSLGIEENVNTYSPWFLALGGMWWIAAAIMVSYFKAAQDTDGYQIGCMIIVPVSLAIGYVLCGAVGYLPLSWLFAILVGVAVFVIGMLVGGKIGDSSPATHAHGSESGLKRAILNALPSSGSYLGSWEYGDIYLDSIGVDIRSSSCVLNLRGSIRFVCKTSHGHSVDTIHSNAREHLIAVVKDLVSRTASSAGEYMERNSGFDGDWSVSAEDIDASFST